MSNSNQFNEVQLRDFYANFFEGDLVDEFEFFGNRDRQACDSENEHPSQSPDFPKDELNRSVVSDPANQFLPLSFTSVCSGSSYRLIDRFEIRNEVVLSSLPFLKLLQSTHHGVGYSIIRSTKCDTHLASSGPLSQWFPRSEMLWNSKEDHEINSTGFNPFNVMFSSNEISHHELKYISNSVYPRYSEQQLSDECNFDGPVSVEILGDGEVIQCFDMSIDQKTGRSRDQLDVSDLVGENEDNITIRDVRFFRVLTIGTCLTFPRGEWVILGGVSIENLKQIELALVF